jgi:hypothetical protein
MKQERYHSTVEYTDRLGTVNREFTIYSKIGKEPTIGDFTEAFRKSGFDVEINDFITMTFRPKDPNDNQLVSLKVLKTFRDYSPIKEA